MRRLVLVRHGRTAWNAEGRAQGHTDGVALDAVGLAQAQRLGPCLAAMRPAMLYSSDLLRARQTAEAIAAASGLEIRLDPRFREYDVGARAGLTIEEYAAAHPEAYEHWRAGDITGGAPGAETTEQVLTRMVPALREVFETTPADTTTIVVSHGAALKASLAEFLGWPTQIGARLGRLANCGWVEIEEARYGPGVLLAAYNRMVPDPAGDPDVVSVPEIG